ncbi:helix-turn-helix domain-containing protein [Paraburkholderia phymatum]|uniref:GP60 n=1 Tax=Paraburkholderia phymatum (strain DSM 17167 / CIP 108236 / LMG 21445 / STM815) TaxID=391038 RepID=B2JD29_PARP8|nr:hypothetical protein [Paraburkholderia phymatum]ACC71085.1 GP60 [Paraburkholderia phymatum STM815]
MSVKVMGMVFDRYPAGGGEMILALKLADHAHDDGTHIFPGIASLAEKTRQSERAVQYQLRSMEKSGWLILVGQGKGGRGKSREYRINPDWINGADIALIVDNSKGEEIAPIDEDAKGANVDTKGCNPEQERVQNEAQKGATAIAPESSVTVKEPSGNRQPARRTSRIALHVQLRATELPDWLPQASWDDWCEHRETKHADGDAPWTRVAAKVSIQKLAMLREQGHDPVICINEAALRGWTGLFPVKGESQQSSGAQAIPADWHKTTAGVTEQGRRLGVTQKEGEVFMRFKARVVKAAGPGEWMEDMLRDAARFGDDHYDGLYRYFNDIPRDKVALAEAA